MANDREQKVSATFEPIDAQQARAHLDYIRRTMEAAGQFTDVPGQGLAWIGVTGLVAAVVNAHIGRGAAPWWHPVDVAIWLWALVVGAAVGVSALWWKAHRRKTPLRQPVLRKLLWGFCPPMVAGALITWVALDAATGLLPVVWLASYGAAVVSVGQLSIPPVRWLGVCELALAAFTACMPAQWGLLGLALGFGLLHVLFGVWIAHHYDG